MDKFEINGVDIFNPLNQRTLDNIIECYIEYFGEEYREKITNKLQNATYLFLGSETPFYSTSNSVVDYYNGKLNDIIGKFNIENGLHKDLAFNVLLDRKLLKYVSKKGKLTKFKLSESQTNNLVKFIESKLHCSCEKDFKGDKEYFLSTILSKQSKVVSKSFKACLKKWNKTCKKNYNLIYKTGIRTRDKFGLVERKTKKIVDEYTRKENKVIEDYIVQKANINPSSVSKKEMDKYVDIFKDIIEKQSDFVTGYDIKNRMDLLTFLNLDKNRPYNECFKDNEVIDFFINDNISKKLKELRKESKQQVLKTSDYIKIAVKKLRKNNVQVDNDAKLEEKIFDFVVNNQGISGRFESNVSSDNKVSNICFLRQNLDLCVDTLIHEMTHLVSSNTFTYKDNDNNIKQYRKVGFYEYGNKNEYGFLNEIINEYVSQEICKIVRQKNIQIGEKKSRECLYSRALPVVEPFFNQHKEEIKKGLMSDDFSYLQNRFGDNMQYLDRIIKKYYETSDWNVMEDATRLNAYKSAVVKVNERIKEQDYNRQNFNFEDKDSFGLKDKEKSHNNDLEQSL